MTNALFEVHQEFNFPRLAGAAELGDKDAAGDSRFMPTFHYDGREGKIVSVTIMASIREEVEDGNVAGYVATIPALPGCVSEGSTRTEARENITDAFKELLGSYGGIENVPFGTGQEEVQVPTSSVTCLNISL